MMRLLKLIAAAAALTVIVRALRGAGGDALANDGGRTNGATDVEASEAEPVLGYDGMDVETLLDWMDDAELDDDTLLEMEAYERANRNRGAVLAAISDRLG